MSFLAGLEELENGENDFLDSKSNNLNYPHMISGVESEQNLSPKHHGDAILPSNSNFLEDLSHYDHNMDGHHEEEVSRYKRPYPEKPSRLMDTSEMRNEQDQAVFLGTMDNMQADDSLNVSESGVPSPPKGVETKTDFRPVVVDEFVKGAESGNQHNRRLTPGPKEESFGHGSAKVEEEGYFAQARNAFNVSDSEEDEKESKKGSERGKSSLGIEGKSSGSILKGKDTYNKKATGESGSKPSFVSLESSGSKKSNTRRASNENKPREKENQGKTKKVSIKMEKTEEIVFSMNEISPKGHQRNLFKGTSRSNLDNVETPESNQSQEKHFERVQTNSKSGRVISRPGFSESIPSTLLVVGSEKEKDSREPITELMAPNEPLGNQSFGQTKPPTQVSLKSQASRNLNNTSMEKGNSSKEESRMSKNLPSKQSLESSKNSEIVGKTPRETKETPVSGRFGNQEDSKESRSGLSFHQESQGSVTSKKSSKINGQTEKAPSQRSFGNSSNNSKNSEKHSDPEETNKPKEGEGYFAQMNQMGLFNPEDDESSESQENREEQDNYAEDDFEEHRIEKKETPNENDEKGNSSVESQKDRKAKNDPATEGNQDLSGNYEQSFGEASQHDEATPNPNEWEREKKEEQSYEVSDKGENSEQLNEENGKNNEENSQYDNGNSQYDNGNSQYDNGNSQYDNGNSQYDNGNTQGFNEEIDRNQNENEDLKESEQEDRFEEKHKTEENESVKGDNGNDFEEEGKEVDIEEHEESKINRGSEAFNEESEGKVDSVNESKEKRFSMEPKQVESEILSEIKEPKEAERKGNKTQENGAKKRPQNVRVSSELKGKQNKMNQRPKTAKASGPKDSGNQRNNSKEKPKVNVKRPVSAVVSMQTKKKQENPKEPSFIMKSSSGQLKKPVKLTSGGKETQKSKENGEKLSFTGVKRPDSKPKSQENQNKTSGSRERPASKTQSQKSVSPAPSANPKRPASGVALKKQPIKKVSVIPSQMTISQEVPASQAPKRPQVKIERMQSKFSGKAKAAVALITKGKKMGNEKGKPKEEINANEKQGPIRGNEEFAVYPGFSVAEVKGGGDQAIRQRKKSAVLDDVQEKNENLEGELAESDQREFEDLEETQKKEENGDGEGEENGEGDDYGKGETGQNEFGEEVGGANQAEVDGEETEQHEEKEEEAEQGDGYNQEFSGAEDQEFKEEEFEETDKKEENGEMNVEEKGEEDQGENEFSQQNDKEAEAHEENGGYETNEYEEDHQEIKEDNEEEAGKLSETPQIQNDEAGNDEGGNEQGNDEANGKGSVEVNEEANEERNEDDNGEKNGEGNGEVNEKVSVSKKKKVDSKNKMSGKMKEFNKKVVGMKSDYERKQKEYAKREEELYNQELIEKRLKSPPIKKPQTKPEKNWVGNGLGRGVFAADEDFNKSKQKLKDPKQKGKEQRQEQKKTATLKNNNWVGHFGGEHETEYKKKMEQEKKLRLKQKAIDFQIQKKVEREKKLEAEMAERQKIKEMREALRNRKVEEQKNLKEKVKEAKPKLQANNFVFQVEDSNQFGGGDQAVPEDPERPLLKKEALKCLKVLDGNARTLKECLGWLEKLRRKQEESNELIKKALRSNKKQQVSGKMSTYVDFCSVLEELEADNFTELDLFSALNPRKETTVALYVVKTALRVLKINGKSLADSQKKAISAFLDFEFGLGPLTEPQFAHGCQNAREFIESQKNEEENDSEFDALLSMLSTSEEKEKSEELELKKREILEELEQLQEKITQIENNPDISMMELYKMTKNSQVQTKKTRRAFKRLISGYQMALIDSTDNALRQLHGRKLQIEGLPDDGADIRAALDQLQEELREEIIGFDQKENDLSEAIAENQVDPSIAEKIRNQKKLIDDELANLRSRPQEHAEKFLMQFSLNRAQTIAAIFLQRYLRGRRARKRVKELREKAVRRYILIKRFVRRMKKLIGKEEEPGLASHPQSIMASILSLKNASGVTIKINEVAVKEEEEAKNCLETIERNSSEITETPNGPEGMRSLKESFAKGQHKKRIENEFLSEDNKKLVSVVKFQMKVRKIQGKVAKDPHEITIDSFLTVTTCQHCKENPIQIVCQCPVAVFCEQCHRDYHSQSHNRRKDKFVHLDKPVSLVPYRPPLNSRSSRGAPSRERISIMMRDSGVNLYEFLNDWDFDQTGEIPLHQLSMALARLRLKLTDRAIEEIKRHAETECKGEMEGTINIKKLADHFHLKNEATSNEAMGARNESLKGTKAHKVVFREAVMQKEQKMAQNENDRRVLKFFPKKILKTEKQFIQNK